MPSVLDDYITYTADSESPRAYHIWCLMSMISTVVGRKTWLNCNYFTIAPNLYIILVSLPGVGKKSTAMRIGQGCVEDAAKMLKGTDAEETFQVRFAQDAITREALIIELEESVSHLKLPDGKQFITSPLTAISSELVVLLKDGAHMIEFLTDIYDAAKSWKYKTKHSGENIITNPCFNLISGITTDNFCSKIVKDAMASGFMSRYIIVYDNDIRCQSPFKLLSKKQNAARERVVKALTRIGQLYGEVTLSKEANDLFEHWYTGEHAKIYKHSTRLEFHSRKPVHVLKSAMLFALSCESLVIEAFHLDWAIKSIDSIEHNMKFIYMAAGSNKHSNVLFKILSAVNAAGSIEKAELMQFFMRDVNLDELEDLIATLYTAEYVKTVMTIPKDASENSKEEIKITKKGKEVFRKFGGEV